MQEANSCGLNSSTDRSLENLSKIRVKMNWAKEIWLQSADIEKCDKHYHIQRQTSVVISREPINGTNWRPSILPNKITWKLRLSLILDAFISNRSESRFVSTWAIETDPGIFSWTKKEQKTSEKLMRKLWLHTLAIIIHSHICSKFHLS